MPVVIPVALGAAATALGGAIGGTILGIATATVLGAVGSVLGSALSYVISRGDKPKFRDNGVPQTVREAVSPRRRVYGEQRVGGVLVHGQIVDRNRRLLMILAVSEGPCRGPKAIYFGEEKVWERTGEPVNGDVAAFGQYLDGWEDWAYLEWWDGSQTAASPHFVAASAEGDDRPTSGNPSTILSAPTGIAVATATESITDYRGNNDEPFQRDVTVVTASWTAAAGGPVSRYRVGWTEANGVRASAFVDGSLTSHELGTTPRVDPATANVTVAAEDASGNWTDAVDGAGEAEAREDVWGADRIGKRIAYVAADLKWDAKRRRFPAGAPSITMDLEGFKQILDPRTGGSGFTRNAALILRHYLKASDIGLDALDTEIDEDAFSAHANLCDEAISLDGGGTEPRYRIDGTVFGDERRADTIREMLAAQASDLIYSSGLFKPVAGTIPTPVMTITDDDLMGGGIVGSFDRPLDATFNSVKGQFRPLETGSVATDYEVVRDANFIADDGRVLFRELNLPFTTSSTAARRLARIALNQGRQKVSMAITLRFSAIHLEPGDVIVWNSAYHGWGPRFFRVKTVSVAASAPGARDGEVAELGIALEIEEADPNSFQVNAADAIAQNFRDRARPPRIALYPPSDVEVAYASRQLADGTTVARTTLTWVASPSPQVTGYELRYSLDGLAQTETVSADATRLERDRPLAELYLRATAPGGVVSQWVRATLAAGSGDPFDTTPPAAPAGWALTANTVGELVASGPLPADRDLAAIRMYLSAPGETFAEAVLNVEQRATVLRSVGVVDGTERRAFLTSIDWSGNESAAVDLGTAVANASAIGVDGNDGKPVAVITVYRRSATAPADPVGGAFDFATTALTPPTSWSLAIPAADGNPAWASTAVIEGASATAVVDPITGWSTATEVLRDGADGADGADATPPQVSLRLTIFRRAASQPSAPFGGSYNIGTGVLTPPSGGWGIDDPGGSDPLWATSETFVFSAATGTVAGGSWSTPVKTVEDGVDGLNGTSVTQVRIYRNATSAPATPSGGSYNFATRTLSSVPSGWTTTPESLPSGETWARWISETTASATLPATVDSTLTWSAPVIAERNGADGTDGTAGARGAGRWNVPVGSLPSTGTAARNAWNAWGDSPGAPAFGDQAWFYTGTESNPTGTRVWVYKGPTGSTSSTNWIEQEEFIDGNLLVAGTVTTSSLVTDGIGSDGRIEINEGNSNDIEFFYDPFSSATPVLIIGTTNSLSPAINIAGWAWTTQMLNLVNTGTGALSRAARFAGRAFDGEVVRIDSDDDDTIGLWVYDAWSGGTYPFNGSRSSLEKPLISATGARDGSIVAVFQRGTAGGDHGIAVFADWDGAGTNLSDYRARSLIGTGSGDAFYSEAGGYNGAPGTTYNPWTGAHFALIAREALARIEPGDILVDLRVIARPSIVDAITEVGLADRAADPRALGVLVRERARPGHVAGLAGMAPPARAALLATHAVVEVAQGGEGLINVCGAAGPIRPGDLIVASGAMPGKGERQADDIRRAATVAKAREGAEIGDGETATIACLYL